MHAIPPSNPGRTDAQKGVSLVDPDNPCAAVCAALASHLLQRPVSLAACRKAIPSDSAGRTSATVLLNGLAQLGFSATAVTLSAEHVSKLNAPLIVFLRESHFAVVLPAGGMSVWFLDPPYDPAFLSVAQLRAQWAGDAILVTTDTETLDANLRRIGLGDSE